MDYTVVQDLCLEEVFGDLKGQLGYSFRNRIFLFDREESGCTVIAEDTVGIGRDKMFCVENPMRQDVFLLPIDGVLFKKESKCDCAVISKGEIDFIEFKCNAANKTDAAIYENYNKASSQLLVTLNEFRERYLSIDKCLDGLAHLECYAVLNRTVPQNNAMKKSIAAKFLIRSNGVKLKFENRKKI